MLTFDLLSMTYAASTFGLSSPCLPILSIIFPRFEINVHLLKSLWMFQPFKYWILYWNTKGFSVEKNSGCLLAPLEDEKVLDRTPKSSYLEPLQHRKVHCQTLVGIIWVKKLTVADCSLCRIINPGFLCTWLGSLPASPVSSGRPPESHNMAFNTPGHHFQGGITESMFCEKNRVC